MLMDKVVEVLKNAREQINVLGSPTDEVNQLLLKEIDGVLSKLQKKNPNQEGFFFWMLEVGIHKTWVADGVDFTDDKLHDMLAHAFRYAYGHELKGKVLSRPPNEEVAKEMGFKSVAEYLKNRKED